MPRGGEMCFAGLHEEMSRHRVEGTCWPTGHAQPAVAASDRYMKIAAQEEGVQMASAVHKCPKEGNIPCLCTSAAMVAMQAKGLPPLGESCPSPRSTKYPGTGNKLLGPRGGRTLST